MPSPHWLTSRSHRPWRWRTPIFLALLIITGVLSAQQLARAAMPAGRNQQPVQLVQAASGPVCTTFEARTTANSNLPVDYVSWLTADGGKLYAALWDGGLATSTDGGNSYTVKNSSNGLTDNKGRVVAVVGNNVYVGTYFGGLSISTDGGNTFLHRTTAHGLSNNNVVALRVVGSTIYAGLQHGGLAISTNGGASFTTRLAGNWVTAVDVVGSTIYASIWEGGLAISTNGGANFAFRGTTDGLPDHRAQHVEVINGIVYVGTYEGLAISTDGGASFTTRTMDNGLGSNYIRDVAVVDDTLYVATANGLSISTDGGISFINYNSADGTGGNFITSIYATATELFLGTDGGVARCRTVALKPTLLVPDTAQTLSADNKISVPVIFTANGANIASVGFALDYQESCLSIDATDSDNNGIPDAISGLPATFTPVIRHDPARTTGELEVALYDELTPITTFSDGPLFTVQYTVKAACRPAPNSTTTVAINFAATPTPTFGDPTAQDVSGTTSGATIALRINAAPTAIVLDDNSVTENSPANTIVGRLSTVDASTGDSHTYSLVSGLGDADNASFILDGDTLKTVALFDYESKNSYTIRVRTTDSTGLFFEQSFTISVTDINEAPLAVDDLVDPRTTVFLSGQSGVIDVLANDIPIMGSLTVSAVTQPAAGKGSVTNNTTNVSYTAPNTNSSGSASFTYQATNGSATSNNANVTVNYVANHARGDCNGNGGVSAADFIGVVLEIFDANNTLYQSKPAWWLSYTGDYAGSPLGCDANNSRNGADNNSASITAADITCSVLIFFGHPCGANVQAADRLATTHLAVVDQQASPGATTTLTVMLDTGGNAIAAATFALSLDPAVLHFATTDADEDGVPDAITLNTPAGMSKSVTWNAAAKRLEVAVFGMSLPLPTLTDGTLATVTIAVANDTTATSTPLALDLVSFSDPDGNDLPFTDQDGTLTITGAPVAPAKALFLPLVVR